jgi:hypothetical protein
MGCAKPRRATVSIASGSATPSISAYTASLTNGIRMRFETKPGKSFASAGVLPRSRASPTIASAVSFDVWSARMTSTSASTGTGLKKCMPITCAGREVTAASSVMGIEDVFEARIACGGSASSAARKRTFFASAFSTIASIMRSASSRSSTTAICASTGSGSGPPFSCSLRRLEAIASSPRSVAPGSVSCSSTSRPDTATTCAMPAPICPAPTTRTRSKLT